MLRQTHGQTERWTDAVTLRRLCCALRAVCALPVWQGRCISVVCRINTLHIVIIRIIINIVVATTPAVELAVSRRRRPQADVAHHEPVRLTTDLHQMRPHQLLLRQPSHTYSTPRHATHTRLFIYLFTYLNTYLLRPRFINMFLIKIAQKYTQQKEQLYNRKMHQAVNNKSSVITIKPHRTDRRGLLLQTE